MNDKQNQSVIDKFKGPSIGRFDYLDWTIGTLCFVILIGVVFGLNFIATAIPLFGTVIAGAIAMQTIQKNEDIKLEHQRIRALQRFSLEVSERLNTAVTRKGAFMSAIEGNNSFKRTMAIRPLPSSDSYPPVDVSELMFLGNAIDKNQAKKGRTPDLNPYDVNYLRIICHNFDYIQESWKKRDELFLSLIDNMNSELKGGEGVWLSVEQMRKVATFGEVARMLKLAEDSLREADQNCLALYEIQKSLPQIAKRLLDSKQLSRLNGFPELLMPEETVNLIKTKIPPLSNDELALLNGTDYPSESTPSYKCGDYGYAITQVSITFS